MKRRDWLSAAGVSGIAGITGLGAHAVWAAGWGEGENYPSCFDGKRFVPESRCRVGNFSGGYEKLFPANLVRAGGTVVALPGRDEFFTGASWAWPAVTPQAYLSASWATGLLIAKQGQVLFEAYQHARDAQMRLTSWSMAKSVTSLLLGICIDKGLIESYDDIAGKYVPELRNALHGQVSLRNLSNMCSGASVNHERSNNQIYPSAISGAKSSVRQTVVQWNERAEEQGTRYNYNELCALTVGLAIRAASGQSLSEFAAEHLWQPLGAEDDAYWLTDSEGCEFNCIGFSARLRDWARLGMMVVNRGEFNGRRILSERWIAEITQWGPRDQAVRFGNALPKQGYKAHFWHAKADGSRPYMNGAFGQRLIMDMKTRTVLVHTAIEQTGNWEAGVFSLVDRVASQA